MIHTLVVVPFFSPNNNRILAAFAGLDGVRLGVISHDPEDRIPAALRGRVAGHVQVGNSLDPAQLTEAGRRFQSSWGRVDRLIGHLEQMQVPLGQARDALGVPGMGEAVALNFREKNRMKQVLREAGVPVARQALVQSGDDARRFAAEVGYPIVMKPPAGLGSKATFRVRNDDELWAAMEQTLPSPAHPVQAEEFITGDEFTMETVSIGGQPVWQSSSYYLPGPLQVLENPWMQYCVLLPRERLPGHAAAFVPTNTQALAALGMHTGLSHMEWFLRPNGQSVVSEVGARPPGVHLMPMMGLAHGVDLYAKWAELLVHERFEMPERQHAVGVAFFRGQGRGRVVREVLGVDEAQRAVGEWVVEARLPQPGQAAAEGYEGEGYAIVRHPHTRGALEALKGLITRVQVVLG